MILSEKKEIEFGLEVNSLVMDLNGTNLATLITDPKITIPLALLSSVCYLLHTSDNNLILIILRLVSVIGLDQTTFNLQPYIEEYISSQFVLDNHLGISTILPASSSMLFPSLMLLSFIQFVLLFV